MTDEAPGPPERTPVPPGDPSTVSLWENVQDALRAVPAYFESGTHIEGLEAADLFNLNSVLGSTIEIQVVDTLNRIRKSGTPATSGPSTDSSGCRRPSRTCN